MSASADNVETVSAGAADVVTVNACQARWTSVELGFCGCGQPTSPIEMN